jgi:DNA repair exonuclease SbcCD ATPase subunit
MQSRFLRHTAFLIAVVFVIGLCLVDADAQRRRKRRVRSAPRPVVTNPDIAAPGSEQSTGPDGERIISTADENLAESEQTHESTASKKRKPTTSDTRDMQQTINALSNQVNRLNEKLNQMQENDRSLIDMERLTRAEQRAESLRTQQVDVESKLADLQSRLEQVDYSLKPENIERSAAGYGATRPEEVREARRRSLENEKSRVQAQIRILETSRARLEQSLATSDAEIDLLRRRLEQQRQQDNTGSVQTGPTPSINPNRPE